MTWMGVEMMWTSRCRFASAVSLIALASCSDSSTRPPLGPSAGLAVTGTSMVSAGGSHACALNSAGTARCWGFGSTGALGNGGTSSRSTPTPVSASGNKFRSVVAGGTHTCAAANNGQGYCWGENSSGQLGEGTTTRRLAPRVVSLPGTVQFMGAGDTHSCAWVGLTGLYCWGYNAYGQVGDGTTISRLLPVGVPVEGAGIVVAPSFTCTGPALTQFPGPLWCWGSNSDGRLGDGTTTDRSSPVIVAGSVPFVSVSAGGASACGVAADGTGYCWGDNGRGELGTGDGNDHHIPTAVATSVKFSSIDVGTLHACGVEEITGAAYCWGWNSSGKLGDGTTVDRATPTAVATSLRFSRISAGGDLTCGVSTTDRIYCWGSASSGQLGIGISGVGQFRAAPTQPVAQW